ncbi:MAG: carbohydrate kinase family protein [Nocardioidaceae bacterium]
MPERAPVVVLGEALVDVTLGRDGSIESHPGGAPVNVAVGLSRLGIPTTLGAQLGDDPAGQLVRAHLDAAGVVLDALPPHRRTSSAVATLDDRGRATYEFDLVWDPQRLPSFLDAPLVYVGSIGATVPPGADAVASWAQQAHAAGVPVAVDPNLRPSLTPRLAPLRRRIEAMTAHAWLVKCSDEDAAVMAPGVDVEDLLVRWLSDGAGVGVAVVTLGADGAMLASPLAMVRVAAPPVEVVDTIGAGDSFMAALLAGLLLRGWCGRDDLDADELAAVGDAAAAAAALTCSRAGADPPWRRELDVAAAVASARSHLRAPQSRGPHPKP